MIGRSATAVFRRPAAWGSVLEVRIAGPFGSAWGLSVTAMLYTTATQNVSLFPIESDVGLGFVDSAPMVRGSYINFKQILFIIVTQQNMVG